VDCDADVTGVTCAAMPALQVVPVALQLLNDPESKDRFLARVVQNVQPDEAREQQQPLRGWLGVVGAGRPPAARLRKLGVGYGDLASLRRRVCAKGRPRPANAPRAMTLRPTTVDVSLRARLTRVGVVEAEVAD
jgi:hypothetical protein